MNFKKKIQPKYYIGINLKKDSILVPIGMFKSKYPLDIDYYCIEDLKYNFIAKICQVFNNITYFGHFWQSFDYLYKIICF